LPWPSSGLNLDSPYREPASQSGLYSAAAAGGTVRGCEWDSWLADAATSSLTGEEVSRKGCIGRGGGDSDTRLCGLRRPETDRRRAEAITACGSLQESAGDGDRELVPKELFLWSVASCLGHMVAEEEESGTRAGDEVVGDCCCCMRQWILNQFDRRPYLHTHQRSLGTYSTKLNLRLRWPASIYSHSVIRLALFENKLQLILFSLI
jgi:hypothetical protein